MMGNGGGVRLLGATVGVCLALGGCGSESADGAGDDAATGGAGGAGGGNGEATAAFTAATTPWLAGPGEEWLQLCQSWQLNNDETLHVNRVVLDAMPGIHHSDWMVLPEGEFPGYDQLVACDEAEFNLFAASAQGTWLFAQSTQSTHEEQSFGEGAVVELPPRSQLFVFMHILNTAAETVETQIEAKLHTIDASEVQLRLRDLSFNMGQGAIELPPRQRTRISAECRFPEPVDFSAYFVLPHYHDWGVGMRFEILGGPNDGTVFWENEGATGEPLAKPITPSVSLAGAEGIRFSCLYDNSGDDPIYYSESGDGEMCFFLMHTDADRGWQTLMDERILPVKRTPGGMVDGVNQIDVGPCLPLDDEALAGFSAGR